MFLVLVSGDETVVVASCPLQHWRLTINTLNKSINLQHVYVLVKVVESTLKKEEKGSLSVGIINLKGEKKRMCTVANEGYSCL